MSWLSSKHVDDISRILRGVALVVAKAAVDSTSQRVALKNAQSAAFAATNAAVLRSQPIAVPRADLHPSSSWSTAGPANNPLLHQLHQQTAVQQVYGSLHNVDQVHAEHSTQFQQHLQQVVHNQDPLADAIHAYNPQSRSRSQTRQQSVMLEMDLHATRQQLGQQVRDNLQQQQQQQQHISPLHTPRSPQLQPDKGCASSTGVAGAQASQPAASAASQLPFDPVLTASVHPHIAPKETPLRQAAVRGSLSSAAAAHLDDHPPASPISVPPLSSSSAVSPGQVDSWMSGHENLATEAEAVLPVAEVPAQNTTAGQQQQQQQKLKVLRERRVPSTQLGRALGFAGMGVSLLFGSITDSVSKSLGGSSGDISGSGSGSGQGVYNNFITEANAERLANALCRMRGAALKIGQMLSIQDENVLPPQVQSALERVRAGADVMPRSQLEGQLVSELGQDWSNNLTEFDFTPRAAASIGQVHAARLLDGSQVAMKIQYPGVARSIESDVDNLMRLIKIANILPKGMYVESAVKVAKRELALECNYTYEAAAQQRFRELVSADPDLNSLFYVPQVYPELSSRQILTTQWVNGITIDKVAELSQEVRDHVGTCLLRLTLRELYDWRFMQTDPNWGNFLYDQDSQVVNLIDFGAAKQYPRRFVDNYLRMVRACAVRDRQAVVDMSVALGFLTGDESAVMLDAHTEAGFVVGMPFSTPGVYDFGAHSGMTPRVAELGSIMLKHRLTPPPEESYSLHRKLSGAFLACMKLRARVPCQDLFFQTFDSYNFEEDASGVEELDVLHSATA